MFGWWNKSSLKGCCFSSCYYCCTGEKLTRNKFVKGDQVCTASRCSCILKHKTSQTLHLRFHTVLIDMIIVFLPLYSKATGCVQTNRLFWMLKQYVRFYTVSETLEWNLEYMNCKVFTVQQWRQQQHNIQCWRCFYYGLDCYAPFCVKPLPLPRLLLASWPPRQTLAF